MAQVVTYDVEDGIAVVTIAHPPVNALNQAVRAQLDAAIERAGHDATVGAVVIFGDGRTFPAGADISEFGKPPLEPWLPDVCNRIEDCPKPVIAAVHGTALGGGFEIALAAHYRIAAPGARFGLPEVKLGVLPGAGGTQRAPRLAGAEAALDMMLTGRAIAVSEPDAAPYFDRLAGEDLRTEALAWARDLAQDGGPVRPTRAVTTGFRDPAAYQAAIQKHRKSLQGNPEKAPFEILRCVEAAALLPFPVGLEFERAAYLTCVGSDQSAALRHAFFSERRAAKLPEMKTGTMREVIEIGIVGGGKMGAGIAVAALDGGFDVHIVEHDVASLQAAMSRVSTVYDRAVSRDRLGRGGRDARLERLTGSIELEGLHDSDLVIEAVDEDMSLKKHVFARLDRIVPPGALMATTTSYLDVDAIAAATDRPGDVVGMHFFAPAHVMRLVEIVVGRASGADAVATCVGVARQMRKVVVRAGVSEGFIGNRVWSAYRTAADYLVEDGASPYQVDRAMRAWGMAQGPYQVSDQAGLDVSWRQRQKFLAQRDPDERYVAIADRLCELGRFGQKSGAGYYRYDGDNGVGEEDPEVIALIDEERAAKAIAPRDFSDEDIQRRCHAAMVIEGVRLLQENIATRPSDIDVVMLFGYGFPRWRGGPMEAADLRGLFEIRRDLDRFGGEDAEFWMPEPLLGELIKNGKNFGSLNVPG